MIAHDADRASKLLRQHSTALNRLRDIIKELEVLREYLERDTPTKEDAPEMAAHAHGITEGLLWGLDHYTCLWVTILNDHYGDDFDAESLFEGENL